MSPAGNGHPGFGRAVQQLAGDLKAQRRAAARLQAARESGMWRDVLPRHRVRFYREARQVGQDRFRLRRGGNQSVGREAEQAKDTD